jgi:hypothetical protein
MVKIQLDEVRNKQEEAATTSDELTRDKREGAYIGNRLNGGPGIFGPFFIQSAWQGSKALFPEYLSYCRGTEANTTIFEDFTDFVNRVILLAKFNDQIPGRGFTGLATRPLWRN